MSVFFAVLSLLFVAVVMAAAIIISMAVMQYSEGGDV